MDIGRGEHAHIRLRDRAMSRAHARVRRTPEGFWIEDLGSPHGLFVNGHRLRGDALLAEGDVLELGQTLLRYQAPLQERPPHSDPLPEAPDAAPGTLPDAVPLEGGCEAPVTDTPGDLPDPPRRGLEGWLVALGVGLALAGLAFTLALTAS